MIKAYENNEIYEIEIEWNDAEGVECYDSFLLTYHPTKGQALSEFYKLNPQAGKTHWHNEQLHCSPEALRLKCSLASPDLDGEEIGFKAQSKLSTPPELTTNAFLGYFWVTIDEYGDLQREFIWKDQNGDPPNDLKKYLWDNPACRAERVFISLA